MFSTGGDGFAAAFSRAADAVGAAEAAQAGLAGHALIKVRMGIHTGEVQERDGDYFGTEVNRAARIMSSASGGQIVASATVVDLAVGSLWTDLGTHRLRDLGAALRLFQLGSGPFAPLRSLDELPGNLPSELDTFVGRVDEIAEVIERLRQHRLVTLTGVGGVGKTRLALQVAADLLTRFAAGCWLVELAPVGDPGLVASAIASGLGVRERPGETPLDAVIRRTNAQELLLVIDNCEHLVDAAAAAVEKLLRESASIRVLATSREGLGLRGEQLIAVPSMRGDSATLFIERANAVTSTAAMDLAVVEGLCERLDGVPLAIELAAARCRSMTPVEIFERLGQRFRLLRGGQRRAERHQTIRAAIEWSFELLDPQEQIVFARLGVFAGGFDLPAAEAVIADDCIDAFDVADRLDSLVAKSMLQVDTSGMAASYRLLESLRQFALEQLHDRDESRIVRDRHAAWCLERVRRVAQGVLSAERGGVVERLGALRPEVNAALDWLLETEQIDAAARMVRPMRAHWAVTGTDEGLRRLAQVIDESDRLPINRQVALLADGCWQAWDRGDFVRTVSWGERALELVESAQLDTPPGVVIGLGTFRIHQGRFDQVGDLARRALAQRRRLRDQLGELACLSVITQVDRASKPPALRIDSAREFHSAAALTADPLWMASSHLTLAFAYFGYDDNVVITHANRVIELAAGGISPHAVVGVAPLAALAYLRRGHRADAARIIRTAIALVDTIGINFQTATLLESAAQTFITVDAAAAATIFGAATAIRDRVGPTLDQIDLSIINEVRSSVDAAVPPSARDAAIADGRLLRLDQVIELINQLCDRCASV